MSKTQNAGVPTLYEIAAMLVTKQAGGEFVDMPTIRLRLGRVGIEASETAMYSIMERFAKRNFVFRTEQNRAAKGEAFVFYTLTDEGRAWTDKWALQLRQLL